MYLVENSCHWCSLPLPFRHRLSLVAITKIALERCVSLLHVFDENGEVKIRSISLYSASTRMYQLLVSQRMMSASIQDSGICASKFRQIHLGVRKGINSPPTAKMMGDEITKESYDRGNSFLPCTGHLRRPVNWIVIVKGHKTIKEHVYIGKHVNLT